ncbi:hypothetical protein M8818_003392 [Zalaria obscura]|uniref:Uncharacterized protein n=1 Tax=Zalaria obscura TaxID=2024903 RepID=A0ACC3SFL8_9PEZI
MSSRAGPVQDVIERLPPAGVDEELRPLPSRWSESDKCSGLEVLLDGTEVRFQGVIKTSDEAAAVRSDHPMPRECGIYYFEVTILSKGKDPTLIGIGFSGPKVNLNRLPGWESESWAYHGDDGFSFACTASGKHYGPKFSTMDVIGCGVNFRTNTAFFTKNGNYLGEAFHSIKTEKLFPSVGMKKPGEHLRVNFGQTPFVYDIDSMMEVRSSDSDIENHYAGAFTDLFLQQERARIGAEIDRSTRRSKKEETALIQELVAQYLAHDGYVETARAFAQEVRDQRRQLGDDDALEAMDPAEDIHAINRQKIRTAILNGDIDRALKYLKSFYPHVLESDRNRDIYFKLRCRKFIEMMRRCNDLQTGASSQAMTDSTTSITSNGHTETKDDEADAGVFDHQMELDDQVQRESHAPSLEPVSIPPPLSTFDSPAPSDDPAESEAMDTTPDPAPTQPQPQPQPQDTKSSAMRHKQLLDKAIAYGQELQAEFSGDARSNYRKVLQDAFALLAYTDARGSVVGGLMEGRGRVEIAEEVNGAVMQSLGKPPSAAIEKCVAQTEVLLDMVQANGGEAALVDLRVYLR